MKNKYNISPNFRCLMDKLNDPNRLPKSWVSDNVDSELEALKDAVFIDASKMAEQYGINIERGLFEKNLDNLNIAVHDYSEQVTFLKDCVNIGIKLKGDYQWKIKGLKVDSYIINSSKYIREGIIYGLLKELDAFEDSERKKERMVDDVLLTMIKSYLQDKDVHYPERWYESVEDYLLDAIEFSYLDLNREGAAQALSLCFLNMDNDRTITISEGAYIYDLLHYCGYINEEQWEDKNLEIYSDKYKYDMVKSFFR